MSNEKIGSEDVLKQPEETQEQVNTETPKAETEEKPKFIKQEKTDKPYWYVVYTYSGYENKVMDNLLKTVENHNLHDTIIDVKVPMEESVEIKNGKKRHVTRKLFPGYVMVKMFLTDESWYVVRNARVVTAVSYTHLFQKCLAMQRTFVPGRRAADSSQCSLTIMNRFRRAWWKKSPEKRNKPECVAK